jgi:hypothetical protein
MPLTRAEIQARYRQRQKLLMGDYERELLKAHEENKRLRAQVEHLCVRIERLEAKVG